MENHLESSDSRAQVAILDINKKIYKVYEGVNTVGCHTNAIISINDEVQNIDIHHAIIVSREGQHFVSDLKSSGGTFVDGTKLVPYKLYELNSGSDIGFGELVTTFKVQTFSPEKTALDNSGADIHEAKTQIINWEQISTPKSDLSKPIPPPPLFDTSDLDEFNDEHLPMLDCDQNLVANISQPNSSPILTIFEAATEVMSFDDPDVTDLTSDKLTVKENSLDCENGNGTEVLPFDDPDVTDVADLTSDKLTVKENLDCENGNSNESLELLNHDIASTSIDTSKKENNNPETSICVGTRADCADSGSDTEDELEAFLNEDTSKANIDDGSGSETDVEVEGLTKVTSTNDGEDSFQRPSISFIDRSIPATQFVAEDMDDSDIIPATQCPEVKPRESQEKDSSNTENSFKLGLTQMMDEDEDDVNIYDMPTQRVGVPLNASIRLIDDTFSAATQKASPGVAVNRLSIIQEKDISTFDDSDILDSTFSPRASTGSKSLDTLRQYFKRNESKSENRSQTSVTMELIAGSLKEGSEKELPEQDNDVHCKEQDISEKVESLENILANEESEAVESGFKPEDITEAADKTAEISQIVERVSRNATSLIRKQSKVVDLEQDLEKQSAIVMKLDSNDIGKDKLVESDDSNKTDIEKIVGLENTNSEKKSDMPEKMINLTDGLEKTVIFNKNDDIIQESEIIERNNATADKQTFKKFIWKKGSKKTSSGDEKCDENNVKSNKPDEDTANEKKRRKSTDLVEHQLLKEGPNDAEKDDTPNIPNDRNGEREQEPEILEQLKSADSETTDEKQKGLKKIRGSKRGQQGSENSDEARNTKDLDEKVDASNNDKDKIQERNRLTKDIKMDKRRRKSTDSVEHQSLKEGPNDVEKVETSSKANDRIEEKEQEPEIIEKQVIRRGGWIKSADSEKQQGLKKIRGSKRGPQALESPDEASNTKELTLAEKADASNKDDGKIQERNMLDKDIKMDKRRRKSIDSVEHQPPNDFEKAETSNKANDRIGEGEPVIIEKQVPRRGGRIKSASSVVTDEKQQEAKNIRGRKQGQQASESPDLAEGSKELVLDDKADASNKDDDNIQKGKMHDKDIKRDKRRRKSTDSVVKLQEEANNFEKTEISDEANERIQEKEQDPEIIEKQVPRRGGRIKSASSAVTDEKQQGSKNIRGRKLNQQASEIPDLAEGSKELILPDKVHVSNKDDDNIQEKKMLKKDKRRRKSTDSVEHQPLKEVPTDSKTAETFNQADDRVQEREQEIIEKQALRRGCRIKSTDSEATDEKQQRSKKIKRKKESPDAPLGASNKDDDIIQETSKNSLKIEEEKQLTRRTVPIKSTDSDTTKSKGRPKSRRQALEESNNIVVEKPVESNQKLNEENENAPDALEISNDTEKKIETINKRGLRRPQAPKSSEASIDVGATKGENNKQSQENEPSSLKIRRLKSETDQVEIDKPVEKRVRIQFASSDASHESRDKQMKNSRRAEKVEDVKLEIEPLKELKQKELVGKRALKRGRPLGSKGSEVKVEGVNNDEEVKEEGVCSGDAFKKPSQTTSPMEKGDSTKNNKRAKLDKPEPEKRSTKRTIKTEVDQNDEEPETKKPQRGRKPKTVNNVKQEANDNDIEEASTSHSSLNSVSPTRSDISGSSVDSSKGKGAKKGLVSAVDSPQRGSRRPKHKVVFTLMENRLLETQIRQLGGTMGDSITTCTVLVTESVKRTPKLLGAVGLGKPICSPDWIVESKKAHEFLDPWDYILTDPEAEKKWDFSLKESLNNSRQQKILENYTFFNQCLDKAEPLKAAIESCGGKYMAKMPATITDKTFIISAAEHKSKLSRILKSNPKIKAIDAEAVVDGVLRQELRSYIYDVDS